MTDLVVVSIISVIGICVISIQLHSYIINENTDRVKDLREKVKDSNYLNEIIKLKKKRKGSLIRKIRKTSLLKKYAMNLR
jgi:hypothetical protein